MVPNNNIGNRQGSLVEALFLTGDFATYSLMDWFDLVDGMEGEEEGKRREEGGRRKFSEKLAEREYQR